MSVTLDANVLVYASNEADPAHGKARTLLGRVAAGPDILHLFWAVLTGDLRIVTHPAVLPVTPRSEGGDAKRRVPPLPPPRPGAG